MDLRALANDIGITGKYPEAMDVIYEHLPPITTPACDLQDLENLQDTYEMFGKYYEQVLQAAKIINQDPLRSTWVKVASQYASGVSLEEACGVPVPEMDGTPATNFLALFVMLPQITPAINEYLRRGFSRAELSELFRGYEESIEIVCRYTGNPGINQDYYNWLSIYTKVKIFILKGFWFEMRELPVSAMWLKNKTTGTLLPIALRGPFTADGKHRVGAAGYTQCDKTLEISFEETAESYIGHGIYDCVASPQKERFPKSEWECVAKPYDPCVSLHIQRGADISPENLGKAIAEAKKLIAERFPEFTGKEIYCSSWLLDPALQKLTGENSRISVFAKCFSRHPIKNNGMSVFGFVFPRHYPNYQDLPEETSLQRKIKKRYIDGKFIYFTSGLYIK